MKLLWPIIKETAIYFWEELFYLVIFNLIAVISLLPGLMVILNSLAADPPIDPIAFIPMTVLMWSLLPFTLFGLSWTGYQITEGNAIKFSTFFSGGWQLIKQAYLWWFINAVVIYLFLVNVRFYDSMTTAWSPWLATLFTGLLFTWALTQLFALTMYPRLIEPGFRLASKNALAMFAQHPIPIIFAAFLSLVIVVTSLRFTPVGWFGATALITLIIQTTTHLILQEMAPKAQS